MELLLNFDIIVTRLWLIHSDGARVGELVPVDDSFRL